MEVDGLYGGRKITRNRKVIRKRKTAKKGGLFFHETFNKLYKKIRGHGEDGGIPVGGIPVGGDYGYGEDDFDGEDGGFYAIQRKKKNGTKYLSNLKIETLAKKLKPLFKKDVSMKSLKVIAEHIQSVPKRQSYPSIKNGLYEEPVYKNMALKKKSTRKTTKSRYQKKTEREKAARKTATKKVREFNKKRTAKKTGKRKLTPYNKFVSVQRRKGLSMSEIGQLWRSK